MSFNLKPVQESQYGWWNTFVEESNGGTLFHRLDFLDYHGEKFKNNEQHLVIYKGDHPFGVFPLAVFDNCIKSPYGASYGGPVFKNNLTYDESTQIVQCIMNYPNVKEIAITLPIFPCYENYSDTFRFCLLENNFKFSNLDISSVVNLQKDIDFIITSRARNMMKKALKNKVNIFSYGKVDDFWKLLELTFAKHNRKPTHTFDEFVGLMKKFPSKIYVDIAYFENRPIAAIGYFGINNLVNSSFYFAQDPEMQHLQGLSYLIYCGLKQSKDRGFKWFDFGTSSSNMKGFSNIFQFKESFGCVGFFRETYKWLKTT